MKIAILGYGVVGSGVARVLDRCTAAVRQRTGAELSLGAIVDIRTFPGDPYEHLLVSDAEAVLSDPSIDTVVETIGGAGIAYEWTHRALSAGKHVVTSNKELVACRGPELMRLAAEHGAHYRYEASVGGGIPIIRPLHHDLAANRIERIAGIVNGTTNFILSAMASGAGSFETVLAEAQRRGYAEQDPSADVDGIDACRKLAILSSIVTGRAVSPDDIHTEGIRALKAADAEAAARRQYRIKLLAVMQRDASDRLSLLVAPHLVPADHPLAQVNDVYNAVQVTGDSVGDVMFYGQGAGTWPTASAVVSDLIELAGGSGLAAGSAVWAPAEADLVRPHHAVPVHAVVRVPFESAGDFAGRIPTAEGPFAEVPGVAVWYEVGADGGLTEGGLAGLMRSFASEHCQILRFWEAGHPRRPF